MTHEIRPYQQAAMKKVGEFLSAPPSRQIVAMATGTGKSHVIADAAMKVHARDGGKTLIVAHRIEILDQLRAKIEHMAPGLVVSTEWGKGKTRRGTEVLVASIQTLSARDRSLIWFEPDLIIFDECHRSTAPTYRSLVERHWALKHQPILGFTATLRRSDRVPLYGWPSSPFDKVLFNYGLREAIEDGWLADLRGYSVTTAINLDGIRVDHGDFAQGQLAQAVNVDARTAVAYESWKRLAVERQTIVFCAGVAHAESVAKFFAAAGVKAAAVSGGTPADLRQDILHRFKEKKLQVITNAQLLTEGFDAPETSCVLMMRPTFSWLAYVQMIGRGSRLAPGKKDCLVIDVVDMISRHDLCRLPRVAGLRDSQNNEGKTLGQYYGIADLTPALDEADDREFDELGMDIEEVSIMRQGVPVQFPFTGRDVAARLGMRLANVYNLLQRLDLPKEHCWLSAPWGSKRVVVGLSHFAVTILCVGRAPQRLGHASELDWTAFKLNALQELVDAEIEADRQGRK